MIAPCTVKEARRVVKAWHRHLPEVQGGLFAAKCLDASGQVRGVAVAGNPSRLWQGTGRIAISRVATDGAPNACSMLYGALCRAAKALGYCEAWTYTLPEEPGTSLRAAGFEDMGLTDGGEHDRPSRRRKPAVRPEPKRRWRRMLDLLARVTFGNFSAEYHPGGLWNVVDARLTDAWRSGMTRDDAIALARALDAQEATR